MIVSENTIVSEDTLDGKSGAPHPMSEKHVSVAEKVWMMSSPGPCWAQPHPRRHEFRAHKSDRIGRFHKPDDV